MATKESIKQTIYDELVTVLDTTTTVSDAADHVGLLQERGEDAQYPFIGFEVFASPHNRGFDGNIHVAEVIRTAGVVEQVIYQRDTTLTVEVGILDRDAHRKDTLYTALTDNMSEYVATDRLSDLHPDIYNLSVGGFSDLSEPADSIHGDRQQFTIQYSHYFQVGDFVPIEQINVSVEDLDEDIVYDSETISV